jgi:GNAT superfamily N-acetyltransferase
VTVGIVDGADTRELRRSVLRPDYGPDDALPGDDMDAVIHFGATTSNGEVLSACLIFPEACPWRPDDSPAWQLRSMATAPSARGHGLGGRVLAAVIDYLATNGGGILWCYAREQAVPVYERGGMTGVGDVFTWHDVRHLSMWRPV